jgi:DNA-binding transcriptional LysR family regulator
VSCGSYEFSFLGYALMDWADRIGRCIGLRDLHILLAVAEFGSMSKASAKLTITHPVVSRTISDLEHTLGVRLFDRNSQGVELTTYGRALLKCGIIVFDEMQQGLKQIEFLANPHSGELRIGCLETMITSVLPAIEGFSLKYPDVRLHVIHENTAMLQFHELRGRNVELLIGRSPRPFLEDDLLLETMFDEPLVAVAGVPSPWARRRHIELAELSEEHWILPPYDGVPGSFIVEIFRASNLQPPPASLVSLSVHLTTTLIATGRFLGFVPSSVVEFDAKLLGLKKLPVNLPVHRIATDIITVKNRTLSPLAALFIDGAREIAKALTKGK